MLKRISQSIKKQGYLYVLSLTAIIILAIFLRLLLFDKAGGDYVTYKTAVEQFSTGTNPYEYTVTSFESNTKDLEHGYAYFPTLLYIQYVIWMLSNITGIIISTVILWKIPTLIAEGLILYIVIKNSENKILNLLLASLWLLNPYFIARFDYGLYDPLFLLFTLLAISQINKNTFKSALFYAIAISLKTIPIILLPLFLVKFFKEKDIKGLLRFSFGGILVFFTISIPFLISARDFLLYLNGSLFVHSERSVQGRPFLSSISYLLQNFNINFHQHEYVKYYAVAALVLATIIPLGLYLTKKLKSKYAWATLSFVIYLLLTPVLSRTHLLWFIPFLMAYLVEKRLNTKKVAVFIVAIWISLFTYLFYWNNGFENYTNSKNIPILKTSEQTWELKRIGRQKYYEYRGILLKQSN